VIIPFMNLSPAPFMLTGPGGAPSVGSSVYAD